MTSNKLPTVLRLALASSCACVLALGPAACSSGPPAGGNSAVSTDAGGGAIGPGSAIGPGGVGGDGSAKEQSLTPEEFEQAVACADLLQIRLGRMAAQNGSDQRVKDLGQRLATNHTAVQVIVSKISISNGRLLPVDLSPEGAAVAARLAALQGADFDKAYMMHLADATTRALAMYRWQGDNCSDAALRQFAGSTAPIMATHARLAEQLNAEVNREELRLAAERKAEEQRLADQKKAEEAAAAAAKKAGVKRGKRGPTSST